ncbi:MAG: hypothetical protein R3E91_03010 [Chlamydiales bacterium]
MTLLAVTIMNGPPPIARQAFLRRSEKITLVTDLVIAILLLLIGSLSLIQKGGIGDLGVLSCLGTTSLEAIVFMIGSSFLIPMSHLIILVVRESKYIRQVHHFEKEREKMFNMKTAELNQRKSSQDKRAADLDLILQEIRNTDHSLVNRAHEVDHYLTKRRAEIEQQAWQLLKEQQEHDLRVKKLRKMYADLQQYQFNKPLNQKKKNRISQSDGLGKRSRSADEKRYRVSHLEDHSKQEISDQTFSLSRKLPMDQSDNHTFLSHTDDRTLLRDLNIKIT